MSEAKFKITDPHSVPVTFVNDVVGSGQVNGVCNITLAVARFTPDSSDTVDPDFVIAARLRMDLYCVHRLYEALGNIIKANEPPPSGTKSN